MCPPLGGLTLCVSELSRHPLDRPRSLCSPRQDCLAAVSCGEPLLVSRCDRHPLILPDFRSVGPALHAALGVFAPSAAAAPLVVPYWPHERWMPLLYYFVWLALPVPTRSVGCLCLAAALWRRRGDLVSDLGGLVSSVTPVLPSGDLNFVVLLGLYARVHFVFGASRVSRRPLSPLRVA